MQKYIVVLFAAFLFLISCNNSTSPEVVVYPDELKTAQSAVLGELSKLTTEMNNYTDSLISLDISANESNIRARLSNFVDDYDYVVEALIMSDKGVINWIEPAKFKDSEGSDVSTQEQIVRLLRDKKPVTSQIFKVVEGYNAIVYLIPVIVDGNIKVNLAVIIDPAKLFKPILEGIALNKDFTFFVLENSGIVLYDPDEFEIGLNTITDPFYQDYPEVVSACTNISKGEEGKESYSFFDTGMKKIIKCEVWWKTLRFVDSDWKIVYKKEETTK